jgi:hypothetical protein
VRDGDVTGVCADEADVGLLAGRAGFRLDRRQQVRPLPLPPPGVGYAGRRHLPLNQVDQPLERERDEGITVLDFDPEPLLGAADEADERQGLDAVMLKGRVIESERAVVDSPVRRPEDADEVGEDSVLVHLVLWSFSRMDAAVPGGDMS